MSGLVLNRVTKSNIPAPGFEIPGLSSALCRTCGSEESEDVSENRFLQLCGVLCPQNVRNTNKSMPGLPLTETCLVLNSTLT